VNSNSTTLRRATLADVAALTPLIASSARALGRADYTQEQLEGALRGAFGVDTKLIEDGSYFVVEDGVADQSARLVGCGGWSRRRTLFGSDARAGRDSTELDPARDAARIRAFFVHPDFARQGIGTRLLERCEREAAAHGFCRLEMMATLPGARLYGARGYALDERVDWPLQPGLTIPFVRMSKAAPPPPARVAEASDADAAEILALQKLAYESEARLYDDWSLAPLTQTLASLREEMAQSLTLKACDGARIVGSVRARIRARDGVCQIGRLIVDPLWQGRGVGTLLLRSIEARFRGARLELFTGNRSEANLRLYRRLGFVPCREQVVSPAITLVFLEKQP
jgi:GNAT superfamily N-acetyltransferase